MQVAVSIVALIGTVFFTAPAAQAWSNDAGVTVTGFASCDTGTPAASVPPKEAWLYLYSDGDIEQAPVDYWTEYFEVRFGDVPASGSWADVWIYCAVPGEPSGWRYTGAVWISRPWITTTALPIFVDA